MIRRPAQYRDIPIYSDSLPFSWNVPLTANGEAPDLTNSTVTVTLFDDGVNKGSLAVDMTNAVSGIVGVTLSQDLYDMVGTYSTWRLRESPIVNDVIMRGRLVKRL